MGHIRLWKLKLQRRGFNLIFTTFKMSRTALAFILFLCGVVICGALQNEESKNDDYGDFGWIRGGMGHKVKIVCTKIMSKIAKNLINGAGTSAGCHSYDYNRDGCNKIR